MILTASDVSSVSQSLHRWELAEYIFEGLVIIACAGELIADLGRKCLTTAHRDRIERFSTILLVAALSMELICLVKTNELSGNVIGSLGDKAEEADRKAKKALDDSALAVAQSGQAILTSRGAVQQATDAERETTRLKGVLADRQLTDAQVKSIGGKLEVFHGQEYTVTAYWDSKESLGIANRIHTALQTFAHWSYSKEGEKSRQFGGVIGVLVWTHPNADDATKRAAAKLVEVLNAEGLEAQPRQQNPNNPNTNTIGIVVGSKR